jgi:hypothetical protein
MLESLHIRNAVDVERIDGPIRILEESYIVKEHRAVNGALTVIVRDFVGVGACPLEEIKCSSYNILVSGAVLLIIYNSSLTCS